MVFPPGIKRATKVWFEVGHRSQALGIHVHVGTYAVAHGDPHSHGSIRAGMVRGWRDGHLFRTGIRGKRLAMSKMNGVPLLVVEFPRVRPDALDGQLFSGPIGKGMLHSKIRDYLACLVDEPSTNSRRTSDLASRSSPMRLLGIGHHQGGFHHHRREWGLTLEGEKQTPRY